MQAENATGKARVAMYLDAAVVQAFRDQAEAEGKGYQTLINDALGCNARVTEKRSYQIIREEIKAT